MSKKTVFTLVMVSMVLALTLTACGGNSVTCPKGYELQNKTQNNPNGYCKSASGDIQPVIVAGGSNTDLGRDWKETKNPLQTLECGLTNADICQK